MPSLSVRDKTHVFGDLTFEPGNLKESVLS